MKHLFILFLALVFTACDKKVGPEGPVGAAGEKGDQGAPQPVATGTITGTIVQYMYNNNTYSTNLNTATVSVKGSTISAVTNASGAYTLNNVPIGVKELLVKKPNNGLLRLRQLALTENALLVANGSVIDKPPYSFTGGYLKDTLNGTSLVGRMYFAPPQQTRYYALFIGFTPDIDPEDPSTYEASFADSRTVNAFSFIFGLQSLPTTQHYMFPGQKMYAKLYPCSGLSGMYDVPEKFMYAIPACGAPIGPAISFYVPNSQ